MHWCAQVLTVLKKRLESRKGPIRFHYREKPLEQPHVAAVEQHAEEALPDDEFLLTVGILRYGQPHRLQVGPIHFEPYNSQETMDVPITFNPNPFYVLLVQSLLL